MTLKNKKFRIVVHFIIAFLCFILYYLTRKKRTITKGYFSLLGLFCLTRGKSNDFFSKLVSFINPPNLKINPNIKPSFIPRTEIESAVEKLNEDGYCMLNAKLPEHFLKELVILGSTVRCMPRSTDKEIEQGIKKNPIPFYPKDNVQQVRYDCISADLLKSQIVQELIMDPSILTVAQKYLNATPILDTVGMWWQTAFQNQPDKEAAQYFHFDFDRIKWLKFFFYLTDVTTDSGPHCFIRKSHKANGIPDQFLKRGYARLTDEEVFSHYDKNNFMEFCAPKGTILIEDTRGLHKGKHVIKGERLLFQLQFSNSLFGTNYPKENLPSDFFYSDFIMKNKLQSVYEFFR